MFENHHGIEAAGVLASELRTKSRRMIRRSRAFSGQSLERKEMPDAILCAAGY
jgi:hypothetical protein